MADRMPVLTAEESALIAQYLRGYKKLLAGEHEVNSPERAHFLAVCRGEAKPVTLHETAFIKYSVRRALVGQELLPEVETKVDVQPAAPPPAKKYPLVPVVPGHSATVEPEPKQTTHPPAPPKKRPLSLPKYDRYNREQDLPETKILVNAVRLARRFDAGWETERTKACVRAVLRQMLRREPSREIVTRVVRAVKADDRFVRGFRADQNERNPRSTGGGRRIVRKPEIFAG
jgi:hypothetical protein